MSFNVDIMSDTQISSLLNKITKVPDWKLKNTQTERVNKRIKLHREHTKALVRDHEQTLQRRRQQRQHQLQREQRVVDSHRRKQPKEQQSNHHKQKDDGLEL